MTEHSIGGFRIIVSPALRDRPNFELSGRLQQILGPKYVSEFNEWSSRFFGIKYTLVSFEGKVFCTEAGYQHFKKHLGMPGRKVFEYNTLNGSMVQKIKV